MTIGQRTTIDNIHFFLSIVLFPVPYIRRILARHFLTIPDSCSTDETVGNYIALQHYLPEVMQEPVLLRTFLTKGLIHPNNTIRLQAINLILLLYLQDYIQPLQRIASHGKTKEERDQAKSTISLLRHPSQVRRDRHGIVKEVLVS